MNDLLKALEALKRNVESLEKVVALLKSEHAKERFEEHQLQLLEDKDE